MTPEQERRFNAEQNYRRVHTEWLRAAMEVQLHEARILALSDKLAPLGKHSETAEFSGLQAQLDDHVAKRDAAKELETKKDAELNAASDALTAAGGEIPPTL